MIEPLHPTAHTAAPGASGAPGAAGLHTGLPVRPGTGRLLVLATVFVCAACGLVYELELVALASYLIGDSVTQASVVLSVMVFAMGIGSLLAKRLRLRAAVGFGAVEAVLALLGGVSAMALYACFAWFGQPRFVLVAFALAIGVLTGAEIPLLMTLIQRIQRQDAGGAVADLFAADYVGALAGGLAFPFLLLPWLGQLSSTLVTGAVNAAAGGALVLWLFRGDLSRRARWALLAANATVLALLALAALLSAPFERAARNAVYGSGVRISEESGAQQAVVTGGGDGAPVSLYLDGQLRVDSADERRYHEALVHPAMAAAGPRRQVLILGGGDGLAAREVLRYREVATVTVVEFDPAVTRMARREPGLVRLNERAYRDPRVRVVHAEAFDWLRWSAPERRYDVVVSDLPDPGQTQSTKLYSQEFYGLAERTMSGGARLAVHASSDRRPGTLWTVAATVRAAGLRPAAYEVSDGGGDWGFVLAGRDSAELRLPPEARALRPRGDEAERPASTLLHPRYGG